MIHKHKYTEAVILVRSPFKLYGSCIDLDITGDHQGVATKEQYDSMCDFKPLIWKQCVWQNISAISICVLDNCIVFEHLLVSIVDLMAKNFYFHFFGTDGILADAVSGYQWPLRIDGTLADPVNGYVLP